MKRHYSTLKEYHIIKRPRLFTRFVDMISKTIIGKNEVVWKTPQPDEPVIFVGNHTRTYAPLAVQFSLNRRTRPWMNANLLKYISSFKFFYHKVFYDFRPRILLRLLLIITLPFVNLYLRGLQGIPVYHDMRLNKTFIKSKQTIDEGMDIMIYPEKNTEHRYKYINDLQVGFVHFAQYYYNKTKRSLSFYPVYICQDLKKILIGSPIKYNPEINIKTQRKEIVKGLIEEISKLAESLPEHKIHDNKSYPPEIADVF